ncbi:MAG: hypothetical protein LBI28_04700 [Treponema sp.]|jgi:hypothetical protein|nr:hypothetical protein [Treponema sp.]
MEATQTANPPSFETVWAILQEVGEKQKETDRQRMKETEERIERQKERQKEHAEWRKEIEQLHKETERITKENAKLIGNLGHNFGDMAEHLVAPNLVEKFRELGFVFEKAYRNTEIKDAKNNIYTEVDITLENGDKVMIVEVKSKLTTENITDHIERMNKVRAHASLHGDKRKFLGTVAGVVMSNNERAFAFKSGFYLIEPSGETFVIRKPEGIYSIREW